MSVRILGPYVAGEVPEKWAHSFDDADGNDIDLTGFTTVTLTYKVNDGDQVERTGALDDGPEGVASYTWVAADLATAGTMRGELAVSNGSSRYAQRFAMRIRPPAGGPLP